MAAEDKKAKTDLGQYFTTNESLKAKVCEFVMNKPTIALEPSIGQGDLITCLVGKFADLKIDMYEIDESIELLDGVDKTKVNYGNFMTQTIDTKYMTIIGNPPYVKTRSGNLYIQFIEKCFNLLSPGGEMVFIVPSDVFKLTGAHTLMSQMYNAGCFTHIYHPNDEKLFKNASIDVVVFRYCLDPELTKTVMYNDVKMFVVNNNGMLTFSDTELGETIKIGDYFNVSVGIVSGNESVFRSETLGNISVMVKPGVMSNYILIDKYPSGTADVDAHLLANKPALIGRKIRKFSEKNWFEWGALRNVEKMKQNGRCIYLSNLTRAVIVAEIGQIGYFGGALIMLNETTPAGYTLESVCDYLNSDKFKSNFMYSGRFKISHRQISQSLIPISELVKP